VWPVFSFLFFLGWRCVGVVGRIHWQLHLVGFSKTAQDTRRYPAAGLSPNLFPFGFGFVVLGVEPRVLHSKGIFHA
jgi:hypothetical protein